MVKQCTSGCGKPYFYAKYDGGYRSRLEVFFCNYYSRFFSNMFDLFQDHSSVFPSLSRQASKAGLKIMPFTCKAIDFGEDWTHSSRPCNICPPSFLKIAISNTAANCQKAAFMVLRCFLLPLEILAICLNTLLASIWG